MLRTETHHALCPKRSDIREGVVSTQTRTGTSINSKAIPQHQTKERPLKTTKDRDTNGTLIVKANDSRDGTLANECESIAHREEFASQKKADKVLLLTGTGKVWNNSERKWIEVKILFDTSADQSFVDSNLAQRIGVKCTQKQRLKMYTFGTTEPKCAEYGLTHVKVSDLEGKQHNLRLFMIPDTIHRRNGVYYVRLPFKEDHTQLPDNRAIANKRLVGILHRLELDPNFLQAHDRTMQDQLEKLKKFPMDNQFLKIA
ncbi:unnamed protein product [Cylicocyclus nassatus]|uniref:Peptidase aspartic putative domain-containing protein n=1 Tax=Cylicocyclus nassatus TaxID=53992 RepID=A0AA36H8M2_CYLNA|nr:unnamed protein product [Cylicocyclus nassatus]